MLWGLSNLWKDGKEGGYSVHHGHCPVNDFGQPQRGEAVNPECPNFFEKAYPCLFPYGVGGPEADRPVEVDFQDHIKWALDYHDHCFAKHETFPFIAFGITQRRQALYSVRLQMRCSTFEADACLLSTITIEKLQRA